jgi:hypothetical protein
MSEFLIDLDELVLRCKNQEARKYIAEAIACYKSGAFRACIVTTWIGVVYDFVYKLRQLELTGDKNAITRLEEFEKARKSKTPELALNFEKKILEWARDEFEFLSPIQYDDLYRLLTDRNRCAHPSMISAEETYQPPAELARYHLRNAISHMLQHPPVQGQAALERLQSDILSEYFPSDTSKAIEYFIHSPLANAKPVLVRNFVASTMKTLLLDNHEDREWERLSAALNAAHQMYLTVSSQVFADSLSKTAQRLNDTQLSNVVHFLSAISDTWQYLSGDVRTRIENYILQVNGNEAIRTLNFAFNIHELSTLAEQRIPNLNGYDIQELTKLNPRTQFVERGITVYCQSGNFYIANEWADGIIIPLIQFMVAKDAEGLIECAAENDQVSYSHRFKGVISEIAKQNLLTRPQLKKLLEKYSFSDEFYYRVFPEEKPSD